MTATLAEILSAEPSSYMTTGAPQDEASKRKRKLAELLIAQGIDTSPVQHWTQGAARIANAMVGGLEMNRADEMDRKRARLSAEERGALPGLDGPPAAPAALPSGELTPPAPRERVATAMSGQSNYADAIASIESGGKYDLLGPVTRTGDRAHGKYQVMGANVGPWTKEVLGRAMTPQEFIADPKAQDAVFQAKFGNYVKKYGPEGAAKAWFAGEGGMNDPNRRDQLGTTVQAYGDKFTKAMGPQVASTASVRPDSTAQPTVRPAAQPAAQPALDPQSAAYIKRLISSSDPKNVAYGMKLYEAAMTRANQPQYGFQIAPDGTVLRTDQRKGTAEEIYRVPSKPTFTETGEIDPQTGQPLKGFVDPVNRKVDTYIPPNRSPTGDSTIPPVPPGVDPKVWRKEHSERATANALPVDPKMVTGLRKEVQELPAYKNLAQAAPVYKSMLEAAGRDNRAADVNLIYGMAKLMDPGSVVRESEMTVAQAVATLPQNLKAQISSQFLETGRLPPDVRAALMEEAHSRISAYKAMYDQTTGFYGGIAKRNRVDEADVIEPFGPFDKFAPAVTPPPVAQPVTGTTKSGLTWSVK